LAFTGACLAGEGHSHFVAQPYKTAFRALLGKAQILTGLAGMGHYGSKFHKDPSLHNALGVVAYTLYGAEGAARMAEAMNPHLPWSSLLGFGTAAIKAANGGPLTTIPYMLDAACNGAEYAHSVPHASKPGLLKAAQEFTHTWETANLAKLQRVKGRAMILVAALKTLDLALAGDPAEISEREFATAVNQAYDRLEGDKWETKLEAAAEKSPEALEQAIHELFQETGKEALSTSLKFAHVLEGAPVDAKRLIERSPVLSSIAAQELREGARERYDQIRERYGVSSAFKTRQPDSASVGAPNA
jgi:hypothetical protein